MQLVSPNEMMHEAKRHMLDGRDPITFTDHCSIMNFVAYNVAPEAALDACRLFAMLYDMPLDDTHIEQIVTFQVSKQLLDTVSLDA